MHRFNELPLELQEHIIGFVNSEHEQHRQLFRHVVAVLREGPGSRCFTELLRGDSHGTEQHVCDLIRRGMPKLAAAQGDRCRYKYLDRKINDIVFLWWSLNRASDDDEDDEDNPSSHYRTYERLNDIVDMYSTSILEGTY